MDVTPLIASDSKVIQSYTGGKFRVSGEVFEGPIVVYPNMVTAWNAPAGFSALTLEHFKDIDGVDVVLLGTGAAFRILPPVLSKALKARGLHVEFMDTGAACRTYNVLMAEGRRVSAALFPL